MFPTIDIYNYGFVAMILFQVMFLILTVNALTTTFSQYKEKLAELVEDYEEIIECAHEQSEEIRTLFQLCDSLEKENYKNKKQRKLLKNKLKLISDLQAQVNVVQE